MTHATRCEHSLLSIIQSYPQHSPSVLVDLSSVPGSVVPSIRVRILSLEDSSSRGGLSQHAPGRHSYQSVATVATLYSSPPQGSELINCLVCQPLDLISLHVTGDLSVPTQQRWNSLPQHPTFSCVHIAKQHGAYNSLNLAATTAHAPCSHVESSRLSTVQTTSSLLANPLHCCRIDPNSPCPNRRCVKTQKDSKINPPLLAEVTSNNAHC